MPILYWMLECAECGCRRVVYDSYFEFVGSSHPEPAPGTGYVGPPLPKRYGCLKGCLKEMRVIGSISNPDDTEMWLCEPHQRINMNRKQIDEWLRLIQDAGLE